MMSKYKEIAKKALLNNFIKKPNITEGMLVYDEKHKEKIIEQGGEYVLFSNAPENPALN